MIWLMVALGGAAGSVFRYGAGRLAVDYFGATTVPATFFVNVSGSFALGLFVTLAASKVTIPLEYRGLIAVGLLGGYTTFSTLSLEAVQLAESGEVFRAGATVVANIAVGLAAAYLGVLTARIF